MKATQREARKGLSFFADARIQIRRLGPSGRVDRLSRSRSRLPIFRDLITALRAPLSYHAVDESLGNRIFFDARAQLTFP